MTAISRRIAIAALFAGFCPCGDPAQAGERYALLVGVRQYIKSELTPLKFTENDIAGLRQVLVATGYSAENLIVMTQTAGAKETRFLPTAENIHRELKLLLADPDEADTDLVAFSGHGVQFKGDSDIYFCPADARLGDSQTLVSLGAVYQALAECAAASKVLLVDACRDEPQSNISKSAAEVQLEPVGRRARPAAPPGGIAAFFSCAAGERSFEVPELRRGVFFHFVIEGLSGQADADRDREVTLPELEQFAGKQVTRYVRSELAESQTPERRGESRGLVSLARVSGPPFAGASPGEKRDDNAQKIELCWCPPGTFQMGSPPDEPDRDKLETQVEVTLTRGYWLGKFEISQAQWEGVMGTTLREQQRLAQADALPGAGPSHPMYYIHHAEATKFCTNLTAVERRAGRLPVNAEYRLPTEAQWEYACRAGATSATAFGDSLSASQANFDGDHPYNGGARGAPLRRTAEVGHYPPNAWGLHDLHGNVWEWCRDAYQTKVPGGYDPEVLEPAALRVFRGGSWKSGGVFCRSAYCGGDDADVRRDTLGFRVALVQPVTQLP